MVTGLEDKVLPNRVQQEQRFHMSVVDYRRRLRDAVRDAGSYTLEQEDALAIELERDLDHLLMQAANLARESLVKHMAAAMQCAVSLVPNPMQVYPDPRKGAES